LRRIRWRILIGCFVAAIASFAAVAPVAGARAGAAPKGDVALGKRLFKTNCGACHSSKAAGTVAKGKHTGPSFDTRRESFARTFRVLVEGQGEMLAFTDRLTFAQLRDVAAFLELATKRNPSSRY
jgi:mono/diheme cytochrome c family protein